VALLSSPIPSWNWPVLTFGSKAIFKFHVAQIVTHYNLVVVTVTYQNGTTVSRTYSEAVTTSKFVGNGTVTLSGKGGLSAGNQLEMDVVVYFAKGTFDSRTPQIYFSPTGAFVAESWLGIPQDSPQIDMQNLPIDANITLVPSGNRWTGYQWVIYNQGGSFTPTMSIDGILFPIVGPIEIGSEDVTVTARTNALLVSLTWVIIAFSILEWRRKQLEP
jgi:hypothetical protein